jgi:subtilisin
MKRRTARLAAVLGLGTALGLGSGSALASAEEIPGRYIVVLEGSVDRPGAVAADHEAEYGAESDAVYRHALNGYVADVPADALGELRADPKVEFVAQDRVVARLPSSSAEVVRCKDVPFEVGALDHLQCLPDGIDRIDADRSSTRSGDGRGREKVNVAIIDSGIDIDHPDLNVAGGVDCTSGSPIADPALYDDYFGHGTFVGGVVGAKDNRRGVVGVAPGTPLWSARVVDDNQEITDSGLICAVDWITSTQTDRNRRNDIPVANMSITGEGSDDGDCGPTNPDALNRAFCRSVKAGTTYTIAAGNGDDDGVPQDVRDWVPPAYDEVLNVTAMADLDGKPGGEGPSDCYGLEWFEPDDQVASFSNFATLDEDKRRTIAAPGVCIDSTIPGGYAIGDGTSFSAPHVAGTAALCIARGKCTDPKQTMHRLLKDAKAYNLAHPNYGFLGDPLDPIGPEYYGYLINAGIY